MHRNRSIIFVLVFLFGSEHLHAEDLSSYTKKLVELVDSFERLNNALEAHIAGNDRYLLAKRMMRLSKAFYVLMETKDEYTSAILSKIAEREVPDNNFDIQIRIQRTICCIKQQLNKDRFEIASMVGVNGGDVAEELSTGLELKISSYNLLVKHYLQMDPSSPDLENQIKHDAKVAHEAAEKLYKSSLAFAKALDPNIGIPDTELGCEPNHN